jgi:hypothetical protein
MAWIELCRGIARSVRLDERQRCKFEKARIHISSGTRPADKADIFGGEYEIGSRVPLEPWRMPTAEEITWLTGDNGDCGDVGRTISIVRVCDPSDDLHGGIAQRAIVDKLLEVCDLDEPLTCIGHTTNRSGLRTTTIDSNTGKYIGLHVDNWDDGHRHDRDVSINRVSINTGEHPRYFLFLPLSVVEIAQLVPDAIASGSIELPDYSGLGRIFMERFPEFPVVRCRLDRNEAYIAPTENLVHDGSSEGQDTFDRQFTILGHIRPL